MVACDFVRHASPSMDKPDEAFVDADELIRGEIVDGAIKCFALASWFHDQSRLNALEPFIDEARRDNFRAGPQSPHKVPKELL